MRTVLIVIPARHPENIPIKSLKIFLSQRTPDNCSIHIVLINDGGNASHLSPLVGSSFTILNNALPVGRARARNQGAFFRESDCILFTDADCIPLNNNWVMNHLAVIDSGASVSCGQIVCNGTGFWPRYQTEISQKRLSKSTDASHQSTENSMISTEAFLSVEGYDTNYIGYGFEDKDLLLRISKKGYRIKSSKNAVVEHSPIDSLYSVTHKIHESAATTASIFAKVHPTEYAKLSYGRIDARFHHGIGGLLIYISATFTTPIIRLSQYLILSPVTPYSAKKSAVKISCALAFMTGSLGKPLKSPRID